MSSKPRHRTRPEPGSATRHNGFVPVRGTEIENAQTSQLRCTRARLKRCDKRLIELECKNIASTGWIPPTFVDGGYDVVHGVETFEAAKELGITEIPVIRIDHLSEAKLRCLRIWFEKKHDLSTFDPEALKLEIEFILDSGEDIDLEQSGFTLPEIDNLFLASPDEEDDHVPEANDNTVVTMRGDLWLFDGGKHRLLCGNALDGEAYAALMQGEKAQMVVADPPYGVPIKGHVSGLGKKTHSEFVQGAKGMSREELEEFLRQSFELMKLHSVDGAVHAIWMDWRGIKQILGAAGGVYHQTLNMCVWDKQQGAMGSLYRSQHELCFIFKTTDHPHVNNVQLGKNGRNRTNVWTYPGLSQRGLSRKQDLTDHPTVKATGLIYELVLDLSTRNGIVLDPFLGSGTTLIAAHRAGRRGFGMELDGKFVDVAIRRIRERAGLKAVLSETGESFEEVAWRRAPEIEEARHG